jgi:hypothetical protein
VHNAAGEDGVRRGDPESPDRRVRGWAVDGIAPPVYNLARPSVTATLERKESVERKDRSWILRAIGLLLVGVGAFAAALGPVELYIFRWFSSGGRFHYEGFGFGSFMFANMAAQILGYYLIAAVFVPLGVGHLTLRRWARPVALGLLGFWLTLGLPLILIVFAIGVASKDLSVVGAALFAIALLVGYFVLPWVCLRFYRSRDCVLIFESRDPHPHWLETLPLSLLVLAMSYGFFALFLHIAILLNGIFPLFGRFVYGMQGATLIDATIWALVLLAWGTLRRWRWAWWGALVLLGGLTVSTIWTLWQTTYAELLAGLEFPLEELEILSGVPAQGWHLALFVGLPLVVTVGLIAYAGPRWRPGRSGP